jgi:ABC-type amino acid transport system permease subunit/photosystem II stability/assembly factor-like uncharacterized protein
MALGDIRRRVARAPKGAGWLACIAMLFLILATGSSHAQEVRSGWEFVESGTESDLLTGEGINGEIWIFGKDGAMGRSLDGGITWDFEPLPSLEEHSWTSSDSGFGSIVVASDDGVVFILEDIGDGVKILNDCILEIPSQVSINAISLTDNDTVVAVGNSGEIWTYYGDGDIECDNWIDRSIEIEEDLLDVSFLDTVNGLVSGTGGTILATTDGGATWDYRDAPAESAQSGIVAIDFFSTVRAYAITDEGQILKSSKEGTSVGVGFVWSIVEIEREYPPGGGSEFEEGGLYLDFEVSSIEVLSQFKLMMTGPNGYLALSKDGGNIVSQQMVPVSNLTVFNGVVMQDGFRGVAIGDSGLIIRTENAGEEEFVGFEVTDFNDFGQFVDYSKERLMDGLVATVKIVLFGIAMGFTIGIILSMLKTSPTTLKNVFQHVFAESIIVTRIAGSVLLIFGISQISGITDEVRGLNLDGWEHIYVPVGAPAAFASILLGIALVVLGAIFISCNGDFSIKEYGRISFDPWGIRPFNAIATLYTDLFRNTPLIVQFMFIHFGLELGRRVQEPGLDLFSFEYLKDNANFLTNIIVTYESDISSPAYGHPTGGILEDRAYISAIFALGLNSGAYQCETIRGAIAAIPSGQMEAGRSIGLNYMQTMKLVIMPQAVRICIPPLGNEMVNLVLNSSLAMVIGYAEITRQGKLIIATTFQIFWTWGMVMISYFVVTWTLALFLRWLEDKTRIPGLGISGGA